MLKSFYKYDKVLSYNGVYTFVIGGRGLGKTYGIKEKAIKDAIRKGEQFIYLRRYKTELGPSRDTFFADVYHKFPNYDFKVFGSKALMARKLRDVKGETEGERKNREKERVWFTIGFFASLSTAQKLKSVSYPMVTKIIYDEFIIEKGNLQYLPDEAVVFNNFFSTVDRYKDKTRAFFLANSVSIMNPYFIKYDIRPDETEEFVTKANGFIVCHFPDSTQFNNEVFETKFGKFIQLTDPEYTAYAVGNDFGDNHANLIEVKGSTAEYIFTLECKNGTFSVWHSSRDNEYFIQSKRPRADEKMFTLVPEKMDTDKILLTFSDKLLSNLRSGFKQGKIAFDEPSTRNTFREIFTRG